MSANCVFCSISDGTIPAKVVAQNDHAIAFHDISPRAPLHILVIPRKHIVNIQHLSDDDAPVVWGMMNLVKKIAQENIPTDDHGFNLISNNGKSAGQVVDHLHWHILSGKDIYKGGLSL